jgi:hypothetical protein
MFQNVATKFEASFGNDTKNSNCIHEEVKSADQFQGIFNTIKKHISSHRILTMVYNFQKY